MSDTSIGLSKDAWNLLNRLKDPGDSFDDVVKGLFAFEFQEDGDNYFLKTPIGWYEFTSFNISGQTIIFNVDQEEGEPFVCTGEMSHQYPNFPLSEIWNKVPCRSDLPVDCSFGIIEDTVKVNEEDPTEIDYEPRYGIIAITDYKVKVEDMQEETVTFLEPGDSIKDDKGEHKLLRIAIWQEDGNEYRRAVMEQSM